MPKYSVDIDTDDVPVKHHKSFGERAFIIDRRGGKRGYIESDHECDRPWGRNNPEARSHAKRCEQRSRNRRDALRYKLKRGEHLTNGYIPDNKQMKEMFD